MALAFGPGFWREALAAPAAPGASPYGSLNAPDANGMMLPNGFSSREIARAGSDVAGYRWHRSPDGMATFSKPDGGWVLTSNSETSAGKGGGASAIEFRSNGSIERAYRILDDTDRNCAGGHTPWGTYLSCEEWDGGQVWECDPLGRWPAVVRPALGTFTHESACVDPVHQHVYLTEDESDGRFYRFTPTNYPDLSSGVLEVATVASGGSVSWATVPDPGVTSCVPTRHQAGGTRFNGGEGTWFDSGIVYFTTKGDNKVHAYDTDTGRYELIYDEDIHPDSPLSGLDGITVSRSGDLYLCEDGGDLDICMITPDRVVSRFLKATGDAHDGSELTGVTFDPSGTRLYFSSMRAYDSGATYEVTGPFRGAGPAAAPIVFGSSQAPGQTAAQPPAAQCSNGDSGDQPSGEGAPAEQPLAYQPPVEESPTGPWPGEEWPADESAKEPKIRIRARRRIGLSKLVRRGVTVRVELNQPGAVSVTLATGEVLSTLKRGETEPQPRNLLLARNKRDLKGAGKHTVKLKLSRKARRKLLRARRASRVMLTAQLETRSGAVDVASRRLRVRRR
jgi:hypothetical protein